MTRINALPVTSSYRLGKDNHIMRTDSGRMSDQLTAALPG
jgi:hypothetical protein